MLDPVRVLRSGRRCRRRRRRRASSGRRRSTRARSTWTAEGVLDVALESALQGESLPIRSGSADPANTHGPESARAADRPATELGADPRGLEERLSSPPGRRGAPLRRGPGAARSHPAPGRMRADDGGTTPQVGVRWKRKASAGGATDEPGAVQAPRRRRRRLHQPGPRRDGRTERRRRRQRDRHRGRRPRRGSRSSASKSPSRTSSTSCAARPPARHGPQGEEGRASLRRRLTGAGFSHRRCGSRLRRPAQPRLGSMCAPDGSPSAGSVAGVEFCVRSDRVRASRRPAFRSCSTRRAAGVQPLPWAFTERLGLRGNPHRAAP